MDGNVIVCAAPFSENSCIVTTVAGGTFDAWITTGTPVPLLIVTSGIVSVLRRPSEQRGFSRLIRWAETVAEDTAQVVQMVLKISRIPGWDIAPAEESAAVTKRRAGFHPGWDGILPHLEVQSTGTRCDSRDSSVHRKDAAIAACPDSK
jgi:hypothetical protein